MPQKRKATKRETPKGSTTAEKKQQKTQRKQEKKQQKAQRKKRQKQIKRTSTNKRNQTSTRATSLQASSSRALSPSRVRATEGAASQSRTSRTNAQPTGSLRNKASASQKPKKKRKTLLVRIFFWILGVVGALFITVLILAMTPLFTIEHVDYVASEHVSSEDLQQLAPIQDGTTLLSVNPFVLNAELRKNPWVEAVILERDFPSTLKISVVEKKVLALVETANAEVAWYLGEDKTWIEPAALPTGEGANNAESILSLATSSHTLLIKDVPDSLNPKAGATVSDEEVLGALQFKQVFSDDLSSKVALYSAPNTSSYSATLQSGVVIALGDTSNIPSKEAVILALLEKHPNQLTYINVKDPSKPTYRKIENTPTTTGTGVTK